MTTAPGSPGYRSLWLEQVERGDADDGVVALRGTTRADVCIVGGGFAGLWTALRIKELEPSADVALVDAATCGSGASGRNGGFMMSWWSKFATLAKLVGTDEALRLARASAGVMNDVEELCRSEAIDARLRVRGWVWGASNDAQVGAWRDVVALLARHDEHPFTAVYPDEVRRRTGCPTMRAGVFEATCATVQPALLAHGLVRVARRRGVRIYERTPMTRLAEGAPCVVSTPEGAVEAERVVLALGAWTGAHVRSLSRSIVVVASDMVATAPAADELDEHGVEPGLAVTDSRLLVNYFHRTADDRVAFGTAGGALALGHRVGGRFDGRSPRSGEVARNLRWMFPRLRAEVAASWTGPIDRSASGLPSVVPVGGGERMWAAAGFSGNGVGPAVVVARVLAALALGRDDEWSRSGLVAQPTGGLPPEPIRFLGGHLVRRAIAARERAEDRGGAPSRLVRELAALAPAGLVPTETEPKER